MQKRYAVTVKDICVSSLGENIFAKRNIRIE